MRRANGTLRTRRMQKVPRAYVAAMWLLLFLFGLRILGQGLLAFLDVSFLPPMEAWYSGLLPYPWLLLSQFVIILLYGKVCFDFTRGHGFFVIPRRNLGLCVLGFGSVYLGVMVARYVIRMSLYPHERWTGGSIPTFFHWILATFLLLFAAYHLSRAREARNGGDALASMSTRWLAFWLVVVGIIAAGIIILLGSQLAHLPPPLS